MSIAIFAYLSDYDENSKEEDNLAYPFPSSDIFLSFSIVEMHIMIIDAFNCVNFSSAITFCFRNLFNICNSCCNKSLKSKKNEKKDKEKSLDKVKKRYRRIKKNFKAK